MQRIYRKFSALTVFAILILTILTISACSNKNDQPSEDATSDVEQATQTMTGVITNVDTDLSQVTVRELDSDIDTILNYNATAYILDKYGEEINGEDLELGQIVETTYTASEAEVVSMDVPDDVWEYQKVDKFKFDSDESSLSVADELYQYTDQTFFASSNKTIQMMELNNEDVLTVRGVGIEVYSVIRTSGHGYVRLSNYSDFIGGMINIGNGIILPVTDNMLITVGAGTYRATISKGSATATKTITVKTDKETELDYSDYTPATKNVGNITFNIEPQGADLYLNGTSVDYSQPIALNYGTYSVTVELTGYTTYTGTLDVEDTAKTINIDLIEEDASVASSATATPSTTDSASSDDSSSSSSSSSTKEVDSDHTISITAPEGVEVYLDNVYKGIAPCKFTKIIGSQTVTLSKSGYVTKSYSVDILDDDSNVKLSFSELVEDSDD